MKTKFILVIIMTALAGMVRGQESRPKAKKTVSPRDSVYAYQFIPKSGTGNPLILRMPVDTGSGGNVKMPNSYRQGGVEPVPMPTHKVEMVKPKKALHYDNE